MNPSVVFKKSMTVTAWTRPTLNLSSTFLGQKDGMSNSKLSLFFFLSLLTWLVCGAGLSPDSATAVTGK